MIYSSSEMNSHIRELQNYLYTIALHNINIPLVLPDGIYGEKTVKAVRTIQHEYGLPETGETDLATWNTIILVCRHYQADAAQQVQIFPDTENCIFCRREHGHRIKILHTMLDALAEEYSNIPCAGDPEEYDEDTYSAIRMIQKRSGLPETGETDRYTWNSIAKLFNRLKTTT